MTTAAEHIEREILDELERLSTRRPKNLTELVGPFDVARGIMRKRLHAAERAGLCLRVGWPSHAVGGWLLTPAGVDALDALHGDPVVD